MNPLRLLPAALMTLICLSATQAATVAHWRFEGDSTTWLQDSSGNALHLTNGNPTGAIQAPGAVNFTGGGSGILSAANTPAWTDLSFTIESIITPDTVSSLRSIAGHLQEGPGRQWLFLIRDGQLNLILNNGGETYFTATDWTLQTGRQYFVGVAIDLTATSTADRITFYLQDLTSGSSIQSQNVTSNYSNLINSTAPLSIGSTGHASARFDGLINEVRFSNEKLGINALLVPEPSRALLLTTGLVLITLHRHRHRPTRRSKTTTA